jgi:hypothetical protein
LWFVNGSEALAQSGRDKGATWRSLGTVCRELDWSKPRAVYELQHGLPFRTVPPGHEHEADWRDANVTHNLNVETSELSFVGFDFLTVGIEVLPPTEATTVSPSVRWAIATTRNLRAENKVPKDTTKAELARLLEAEAQKAVRGGKLGRALKASYLENQLVPWGIWPLSSFE